MVILCIASQAVSVYGLPTSENGEYDVRAIIDSSYNKAYIQMEFLVNGTENPDLYNTVFVLSSVQTDATARQNVHEGLQKALEAYYSKINERLSVHNTTIEISPATRFSKFGENLAKVSIAYVLNFPKEGYSTNLPKAYFTPSVEGEIKISGQSFRAEDLILDLSSMEQTDFSQQTYERRTLYYAEKEYTSGKDAWTIAVSVFMPPDAMMVSSDGSGFTYVTYGDLSYLAVIPLSVSLIILSVCMHVLRSRKHA